ncbi:hypothetical protein JCGZ_00561 [Jatropha curcas]|uniref:Uncharacterized protein n=1 Tax=Jatropha curcas TaxID=180498 RepID=A0A067JQH6_JATCU|nr:hypothetical protein JCGZ_00561 [Jatropha curcas]
MAERVKDRVRDHFERKIDRLHRAADIITFPLAPLDGAIHGIARGALNWLTDTHPEEKPKPCNETCLPPQPQSCFAPPPPPASYAYPPAPSPPPPPPPYYTNPSQPGPGYPYPPYSYYNTGGHTNTGNDNNSSGQTNNGAVKFGNIGSS